MRIYKNFSILALVYISIFVCIHTASVFSGKSKEVKKDTDIPIHIMVDIYEKYIEIFMQSDHYSQVASAEEREYKEVVKDLKKIEVYVYPAEGTNKIKVRIGNNTDFQLDNNLSLVFVDLPTVKEGKNINITKLLCSESYIPKGIFLLDEINENKKMGKRDVLHLVHYTADNHVLKGLDRDEPATFWYITDLSGYYNNYFQITTDRDLFNKYFKSRSKVTNQTKHYVV